MIKISIQKEGHLKSVISFLMISNSLLNVTYIIELITDKILFKIHHMIPRSESIQIDY